jgi:hypothetical protein
MILEGFSNSTEGHFFSRSSEENLAPAWHR